MKMLLGVALCGALLSIAAEPLAAQRAYTVGFTGTRAEHAVRAGSAVESSTGALFGGEVSTTGSWIAVRAHAVSGTLTAESQAGVDRTLGEVGLEASALALPWLAFNVGGFARSYTAPIARQRWLAMTTGVEARVDLLDGALRGAAQVGLMPAIHVSGIGSPDLAIHSAVSLAYRGRLITGSIGYSIERFDFPEASGIRRLEELARLTGILALRFGR